MLNNRLKSIKNRNADLLLEYLSNYEELDRMHGAYGNYASMILDWADGRDLLKAPKFRVNFSGYIYDKADRSGMKYSENYVYSSCLFVRDFFRFCKAVLPEEDTELITDYWLRNLVPSRSSSKRLTFSWLTDEDLRKLLKTRFEKNRLKRAQAAVLLSAVTGMSRSALLTIPIREIDFEDLLVYQYPERGVYTEKMASGITHISPNMEIIDFLKDYTGELRNVSPEDCTWFIRYSRHGAPQPVKFGEITGKNQKEAYRFALSPYGRLKEDLLKISEACRIPQITMSLAQNTYIYNRLIEDGSMDNLKKIAADLMIKDIAPIRQCMKLLDQM